MRGKNNPQYGKVRKRKIKRMGYIHIYKPEHPRASKQGYIPEQVLIVEENIGRYLKDSEVVHHINLVKDDNRIENLQLMTTKEHGRIHMIGNKYGLGIKCSEESKEKMRRKMKGRKLSEEHKRKISEGHKGLRRNNS